MFQAPEILENAFHDYKADIWSFGCIIYNICHFGYTFKETSEAKLIAKIKKGKYHPIEPRFNIEFISLFEMCMKVNPEDRPSAGNILGFSFVQKWAKELRYNNPQIRKYMKEQNENMESIFKRNDSIESNDLEFRPNT